MVNLYFLYYLLFTTIFVLNLGLFSCAQYILYIWLRTIIRRPFCVSLAVLVFIFVRIYKLFLRIFFYTYLSKIASLGHKEIMTCMLLLS